MFVPLRVLPEVVAFRQHVFNLLPGNIIDIPAGVPAGTPSFLPIGVDVGSNPETLSYVETSHVNTTAGIFAAAASSSTTTIPSSFYALRAPPRCIPALGSQSHRASI